MLTQNGQLLSCVTFPFSERNVHTVRSKRDLTLETICEMKFTDTVRIFTDYFKCLRLLSKLTHYRSLARKLPYSVSRNYGTYGYSVVRH